MKILLWFTIAALVGAYICIPLSDPDLWWHITVGRWIVAHGAVPTVDYWNVFAAGTPWRAYSWSNEVVYALVDRSYGEFGLAVLQLGVVIALALSFQYLLGRLARDHFVGALLGVYATVACFAHVSLRPQTIVWIFFLAALVLADDSLRARGRVRSLVLLGLVGALWANTHLSAVIGAVGVCLWIAGRHGGRGWWWAAAVALGVFVAGTVCTPYVGGEWLTFLDTSGHALQFRSIDEFKPANIMQFSTGFVIILVSLLLTLCVTTRVWPSVGRLALAGGMLLAGLTAVKFLPFAVVSLSAVIAAWWRETREGARGETSHLVEGVEALKARFNQLHPQTVGALVFFCGCMAFVYGNRYVEVKAFGAILPKRAVDFIESKSLSHPVLNDFGSGGYLMYRFSGPDGEARHRVSIDGRTNVNPPEIWRIYENAFFGRAGWSEYIERLQPKTIVWKQDSPLIQLLVLSPEWCRVFQTGASSRDYSVFVSKEEFERRAGELSSTDCVNSM